MRLLPHGTKDQTLEVILAEKRALAKPKFEFPFDDGCYEKFEDQMQRERAEPGGSP